MLKSIFNLLIMTMLIAWFFITIAGYEFSIQLKPFKVHFKLYDWQGLIILITIIFLFFSYGYICQERGKKEALQNTTEQIFKPEQHAN